MGHLGHLKQEYADLVERLEGSQFSFPMPEAPEARAAWQEILEILFTTEDAALAAKIPVRPSSLKRIAARVGMTPEELRPRLDAMADKGLIFDLVHPKTGKERWMLAPPIVGFVEFSLMRAHDSIPQKRISKAMDLYVHRDGTFSREVFNGETTIGRALINENVLGEDQAPRVLGWERASEVISTASTIAVAHCYCRHMAEHLGHACDAPLENCLSLNVGADFVVRRKFGRQIESAEALDILAAARDHGLVQIADNVRNNITFICNCCGCCCGQLRSITEFDFPAVNPSGFEPSPDLNACKGCSKCSRACPIGAISMVQVRVTGQRKGRLVPKVDLDRCIGCGVCAAACRRGAMTMVERSERRYVPATLMERALRLAMERGHLAHFIFDQGHSRGFKFLNTALQVILDLPAAQRALANEQLKSRFIRFALGTSKNPID